LESQKSSHLRNTVVLLVIIVGIAMLLSLTSYEYTVSISNSITSSSNEASNTNAQIEATEINHILADELSAVAKNLQILATSSEVESRDVAAAAPLFSAFQNATSAITYSYFWGTADGSLLLARNATSNLTPVAGLNLTQRPYFAGAEESGGATYYSNAIDSSKGVPTIYIAQPTYNVSVVEGHEVDRFSGIVGASIGVSILGRYLQSQLPANLEAGLGAVDPDGVVLYTGNQTLVGQSIFGPEFQAVIPAGFRDEFNDFLHTSLDGGSGVDNLSYNGTSVTFAYQPVLVGENSTDQAKPFAVLYIFAADVLAASQASQIALLRLLFQGLIIGIGASAIVAALVVLRWNRSLDVIVKRRTADLVLANEKISAQSQAQRDLINIAAHELRTPTQSILINSEILKDMLDHPAAPAPPSSSSSLSAPAGPAPAAGAAIQAQDGDARSLVDSTFRNARRLQKLTEDLLEVARIDSKNVQLELETFDLNEKIRQVEADFRNILDVDRPEDRIQIVLESEEDKLLVRADRVKTYEILSNLLRNAIRHSSPRGKITISTARSGDYALVEIVDEGTGIDTGVLSRLFEKFATNAGTGLGLFISKSYVEAQGGKIWAKNNAKDGRPGATFSFTLPLDLGEGDRPR
jgi:signal transduction histidine kinase